MGIKVVRYGQFLRMLIFVFLLLDVLPLVKKKQHQFQAPYPHTHLATGLATRYYCIKLILKVVKSHDTAQIGIG